MDICVTGASHGLGSQLCKQLAADGHRVWGVARDEQALHALRDELGDACRVSVVDMRSDASVTSWMREMQAAGFRPEVAILSASIKADDMGEAFDFKTAHEVIDTNLLGVLRCVEGLLPGFLAHGRGTFMLIASTATLRPTVRACSYCASKAGAAMAFRALSQHFGSSALRFKTVYLGPMSTRMWDGRDSWLVASPQAVARRIARFMHDKRQTLFYPWLATMLLRVSLWLPDSVFVWVNRRILK
jgi:uncharacterized protein